MAKTPQSNSTLAGLSLPAKVHEWSRHFLMRWRERGAIDNLVRNLDHSLAEYAGVYAEITGRRLQDARILEVGYGARPLRMFWLASLGHDVRGVDLDRPVLNGTAAEFRQMWEVNGAQRALKSAVRYFAFDRPEWRRLDWVLRSRGGALKIDPSRFVVQDAAKVDFAQLCPGGVDFIYSEDVFEHVPAAALERVLQNLAKALAPGGCALFRPHVFSSICGGHLPEWYPHLAQGRPVDDATCRSEPWEHLRKRRFKANTFLNELRIADYRRMLGAHFEIVSELNSQPELGRRFLTPQILAELEGFTEEELLLNSIRFVCRARGRVS